MANKAFKADFQRLALVFKVVFWFGLGGWPYSLLSAALDLQPRDKCGDSDERCIQDSNA